MEGELLTSPQPILGNLHNPTHTMRHERGRHAHTCTCTCMYAQPHTYTVHLLRRGAHTRERVCTLKRTYCTHTHTSPTQNMTHTHTLAQRGIKITQVTLGRAYAASPTQAGQSSGQHNRGGGRGAEKEATIHPYLPYYRPKIYNFGDFFYLLYPI